VHRATVRSSVGRRRTFAARCSWAACVIAVASAIVIGNAQDYTQWRGSSGDGSASSFSAPATWPQQLKRKWRVTVGEGYSTPLLSGKIVYAFTRRDGNEVMTALDAETGKERWHSEYPAPYTPGQPASAHGAGPKATPLLTGGRLFTVGISGIVAAFDAVTGQILWRLPAPAEAPFFGAAASPVAAGGLVFAHPGDYGPLTAIDAASGTVKWTAGESGFFASPLVATLSGVNQIITVTQGGVIGVSIPDGRVLWTYAWPGGEGGTMPVLYGETVIVGGLNAGVAAFAPKLRNGKWTVESAWTSKAATSYLSNPVIVGNALYGFSRRASGQFFALDAATGRKLWLGPPREATNVAIVKAGEFLFFLKDDGELIVAKANLLHLQVVRRYQVADASTWAQPVISGKRMLIKDVSTLSMWTFE
jgi:outer membrane protein assembly factor BamB